MLHSVVKSSPVPISNAEAEESIGILTELCPFFLQRLVIGREEWLEMPAPPSDMTKAQPESITKDELLPVCSTPTSSPKKIRIPTSPGMVRQVSDPNLLQGSPRIFNNGNQGVLRVVRERIRKELESYD